uniref:Myb-like domain-containing protein n=1 Tax=Arundo donax TaxID=35708 RepID=A0A0A8Y013_ARUDO
MKPSRKRTKNFSEQEDILLVQAWLEISMDPIHGNEQSRSTYWERIHDHFHKHRNFESDHSANSLTHRWSTILESVNRFCGWYYQIQNRRQRVVTEQDKVFQACELYKSKDKNKKSFVCCIVGISCSMSKSGKIGVLKRNKRFQPMQVQEPLLQESMKVDMMSKGIVVLRSP